MNDVVFASMLDKRFKKDRNPHKFAIIWTSKFYRLVNNCMRNKEIDEQVKEIPHAVYFIKNYIDYFYKHGVQSNDISSKRLYRGYKLQYTLDHEIKDNGFISVSCSSSVAHEFAGLGGNVIVFKTKHLPIHVPFVKITQDIVPYSSEEEYVFLPGTITRLNKYSEYKPNIDLIKMYQAIELPIKGGAVNLFEDIDIDLRDKLVVWYRAIHNRTVDIIGITRLPKTIKQIKDTWKTQVDLNDDKFEDATQLIPEYQDLIKEKNSISNTPTTRIDISRKISSYNIYTAIVERNTINILSINYGIPKAMFDEMFDMKRVNEVKLAISQKLKNNIFY